MKQELTTKELFRATTILWGALLLGQLLIILALFFISQEQLSFRAFDGSIFLMLAPFLLISGIALSFFLSRKQNESADKQDSLVQKLEHFRTTTILRAAPIEGANLMLIVFMFIETNLIYLLFAFVGMLVFLLIRPSKDRFSQDYSLSSAEEVELRGF